MIKIIFSFVILATLIACSDSKEIQQVKNSSLSLCPKKTVGKMVDGYFANPTWSSGKSQGNKDVKDGLVLVNVKGRITYMEKPVDAVMQFLFHEDGKNFEVTALEINGLPQNALMINALLDNMCKQGSDVNSNKTSNSEPSIIAEFKQSKLNGTNVPGGGIRCNKTLLPDLFGGNPALNVAVYKDEEILLVRGNSMIGTDKVYVMVLFTMDEYEEFIPAIAKISAKHDFKEITNIPTKFKDADVAELFGQIDESEQVLDAGTFLIAMCM